METLNIAGMPCASCEFCNRFFRIQDLANHRRSHFVKSPLSEMPTLPMQKVSPPQTKETVSFGPSPGSPFSPSVLEMARNFKFQNSPPPGISGDMPRPSMMNINHSNNQPSVRKRGRPRKNPDEPRKKRGAIEYDPNGDSCTRILMEYRKSLIRRATLQHQQNSLQPPPIVKNQPVIQPLNQQPPRPAQANHAKAYTNQKNPPERSDMSQESIHRYHNFDYNSNIA